jgi:hypothetical protein
VKIRGAVYEALSPRQRIIAAMDAIGRHDTAEVERLKSTCPIKTYRQRDAAFSDTMEALFGTGPAVEADLRGAALWWWMVRAIPNQGDALLKNMAAIEGAWLALLGDMSITSPTATAPPRHPLVAHLLGIAPEPDSDRVSENYELLKVGVTS